MQICVIDVQPIYISAYLPFIFIFVIVGLSLFLCFLPEQGVLVMNLGLKNNEKFWSTKSQRHRWFGCRTCTGIFFIHLQNLPLVLRLAQTRSLAIGWQLVCNNFHPSSPRFLPAIGKAMRGFFFLSFFLRTKAFYVLLSQHQTLNPPPPPNWCRLQQIS